MKLHFIRFLIFFIVVLAKIFASDAASCKAHADGSPSGQSSMPRSFTSQESHYLCNSCGSPLSTGASTNDLTQGSFQTSPARSSSYPITAADYCTPARATRVLPPIVKGVEVGKVTASTSEEMTVRSFVETVNRLFKERSGQGFDVVDQKILKKILEINQLDAKTQAQMPCVFAFLERGAQEASVLLTVKLPVPELESQNAVSPLSGQKQKILTRTKGAQKDLDAARSLFSSPETELKEVQYNLQELFSAFVTRNDELLYNLERQVFSQEEEALKKQSKLKAKILGKAGRTVELTSILSVCEIKIAELSKEIDKESERRSYERIRLKRQAMQPYMHALDASLDTYQQFERIRALVLPFSHTERQALSACLFSHLPTVEGTMFCYTRAKPCNHAEGSDNQGLPCVNIYSILGEVYKNVEFRVFFKDETYNEGFSVQQTARVFEFIKNTKDDFLNHLLQGRLAEGEMQSINLLLTNLLNPEFDRVRRAELSDILFKHIEISAPTEIRTGFYNSIYGTRNVRYIRI